MGDLLYSDNNDDRIDGVILPANTKTATIGLAAGAGHREYTAASGCRRFKLLYNAHTASRAAGLPCYYALANTTAPGLEVTQATTGNLNEFAGIHAETVTSGAWGWVQVEGAYPTAIIRSYGSATNADMTAGCWLGIGINGVDDLCTNAAATCEPDTGTPGITGGYCVSLLSHASAAASSTTTTAVVLVYGMVR